MESKAGFAGDPPSYGAAPTPYPVASSYPAAGGPQPQAPYAQPPVHGYAAQPAYVVPQYGAIQQGQQQPVVVVNASSQQQQAHVQSFVGHVVFACIVFWCCNCMFGLIAFILASQYSLVSCNCIANE